MSNDIIKKIKLLRQVEPDAAFKETNRKILMMQIKNTLDLGVMRKNTLNTLLETFNVFFPWQMMKTAFRPVLAVLLIFGLILGSGLSVSAAESSLPGDALYSLKLATEKIQVSLTFKEEKKTEKHVELAGKRINEVAKIKDKPVPLVEKSKKINIAVSKFKEEIEGVKANLEKIEKKIEPQKVVEVAKIVDVKANEYQEALQKTVNDLEAPVKEVVVAQVNEGLESVEKVGDKALEVIVKKHVQGEVISPEEEVVKRLEKKIEIVENKVIKVEEQVAALTNTSPSEPASSEEPTEEPTEEPAPPVSSEVRQTTAQIQEATNQVKEVLDQAKELLTSDQKDLGAVLDKVIESKELVKQAEQIAASAAAVSQVGTGAAGTGVNANEDVINNVNTNTNTANINVNTDENANANTNVNVNINTNVNADANTNTNTNTDVNADVNADVNENQNINVNTNSNTNANTNT